MSNRKKPGSRGPKLNNAKQQLDAGAIPSEKRAKSFKNFQAVAEYAKSLVYFLIRLRPQDNGVQYLNLGTAFLAGKNRVLTCAHCINAREPHGDPIQYHQAGDSYLFVQRDEFGNWHRYSQALTLDESLFLYPEIDTAVLYINDDFYHSNGEYYRMPGMYLELDRNIASIGTDIGILGYPFAEISFDLSGIPDLEAVVIRGDKGVVNTRRVFPDVIRYETTTSFNPGNSGGPIFNIRTGAIIGIVSGYNPLPMHWMKDTVQQGELNHQTDTDYYHRLRCIYSYGVSSESILPIADQHALGRF